jgi:transposase
MKEISVNQKVKVIKLFLCGLSYDEISQQVGIAKGSVVNIVNEFREGLISLPPGVSEYVDELRKLVVDMKKHDTTVSQLKGYVKLHEKLKEMGVGIEYANMWLDACQDIATSSVTNNQFVKSALELAQLTFSNGKSATDVIADYNEKLEASLKLGKDIAHKKEKLGELEEEKKQDTATLDTVNKAIAAAHDVFQKQKKELESQLDDYLAQNKLSWNKVNMTMAILNTGLSDCGLGEEDAKKVSGDIDHAGSLIAYIKQHEFEKAELETEINKLTIKHQEIETSNTALEMMKSDLTASIQDKTEVEKEISDVLYGETNKLAEVGKIISCHVDLIGITRLLLTFLTTSDKLSGSDIEELTRMIIFIRQARLGITPDKCKFIDGSYIYECKLPSSYFATSLRYPYSIDMARKKLATIITPLIQNEFMPRFEWDIKELQAIKLKCIEMYVELMRLPIQQK